MLITHILYTAADVSSANFEAALNTLLFLYQFICVLLSNWCSVKIVCSIDVISNGIGDSTSAISNPFYLHSACRRNGYFLWFMLNHKSITCWHTIYKNLNIISVFSSIIPNPNLCILCIGFMSNCIILCFCIFIL